MTGNEAVTRQPAWPMHRVRVLPGRRVPTSGSIMSFYAHALYGCKLLGV